MEARHETRKREERGPLVGDEAGEVKRREKERKRGHRVREAMASFGCNENRVRLGENRTFLHP